MINPLRAYLEYQLQFLPPRERSNEQGRQNLLRTPRVHRLRGSAKGSLRAQLTYLGRTRRRLEGMLAILEREPVPDSYSNARLARWMQKRYREDGAQLSYASIYQTIFPPNRKGRAKKTRGQP